MSDGPSDMARAEERKLAERIRGMAPNEVVKWVEFGDSEGESGFDAFNALFFGTKSLVIDRLRVVIEALKATPSCGFTFEMVDAMGNPVEFGDSEGGRGEPDTLDHKVATGIMGYVWDIERGKYRCPVSPGATPGVITSMPPTYSTNMDLALKVAATLAAFGWGFSLTYTTVPGISGWDAHFSRGNKSYRCFGNSPAESLCRAALKANLVKETTKDKRGMVHHGFGYEWQNTPPEGEGDFYYDGPLPGVGGSNFVGIVTLASGYSNVACKERFVSAYAPPRRCEVTKGILPHKYVRARIGEWTGKWAGPKGGLRSL